jgi:hypothetical protein
MGYLLVSHYARPHTKILTGPDIDPEAQLADVLRCISDHPASCLHELLPWNWRKQAFEQQAQAA